MEPQTLSISRDLCWTPAIERDFWMVSSSCSGRSRSESSRVIGNADGRWNSKGRAATFIAGCGTFMVTDWADKEKGNRQPTVNTVKKRVFRMVSSSIQFAFCPLDALSHRGIQIRGLLKGLEPLRSIGVPPFEQKID